MINGVAVKPSITRGACPAYGITRDRLAAIGPLFGGGRFSGFMRKRLPNSWSGLLAGSALIASGELLC
jgi:hypothetical protein